jgi:hypothetical protein
LPDQPIGNLGHAPLPDIERIERRAIEQGGKSDLHALAHATGVEKSDAIVHADVQAVAIDQALVQ